MTARKKNRSEQIVLRVEPDLRVAIKAEAEKQRRPICNLVRNVLADWIAARVAQQHTGKQTHG